MQQPPGKIESIDDRMAKVLRGKTEAECFAMIDKFWQLRSAPTDPGEHRS